MTAVVQIWVVLGKCASALLSVIKGECAGECRQGLGAISARAVDDGKIIPADGILRKALHKLVEQCQHPIASIEGNVEVDQLEKVTRSQFRDNQELIDEVVELVDSLSDGVSAGQLHG